MNTKNFSAILLVIAILILFSCGDSSKITKKDDLFGYWFFYQNSQMAHKSANKAVLFFKNNQEMILASSKGLFKGKYSIDKESNMILDYSDVSDLQNNYLESHKIGEKSENGVFDVYINKRGELQKAYMYKIKNPAYIKMLGNSFMTVDDIESKTNLESKVAVGKSIYWKALRKSPVENNIFSPNVETWIKNEQKKILSEIENGILGKEGFADSRESTTEKDKNSSKESFKLSPNRQVDSDNNISSSRDRKVTDYEKQLKEEKKKQEEEKLKLQNQINEIQKEKERFRKSEEKKRIKAEEERIRKILDAEKLRNLKVSRDWWEEEETGNKSLENSITRVGELVPITEAEKKPVKISGNNPVFPTSVRSKFAGNKFEARIMCLINENGEVKSARVLNSVPKDIKNAIEKAVMKWEFIPAEKNGIKVSVWSQVNLKISI